MLPLPPGHKPTSADRGTLRGPQVTFVVAQSRLLALGAGPGIWHGKGVSGPSTDAVGLRMRPPQHRVSPRAILYWTVRAACGWVLVIAAQVLWMLLASDGMARLHVLGLLATLLVAVAHLLVMPQWRFRVHRWEATPDAVYTQAGWFDQQRRIAPISRSQT